MLSLHNKITSKPIIQKVRHYLKILNFDCFFESYFKFYFTLLCSSFQLSLTLLVHYRYLTVFSLRGLVPLSSNKDYSLYSNLNIFTFYRTLLPSLVSIIQNIFY